MDIVIRMSIENTYEMTDIITAFHYGLQLAREEMEKKGHKVFAQILKEIHENEPSIQDIIK